jgi:hypothetical protein
MTTNFQIDNNNISQFIISQQEVYPGGIYTPVGVREPRISGGSTITNAQLRQARDSVLFVATDATYNIQIGTADSPEVAAELQSALGLVNAGDQCLLHFASYTLNPVEPVNISNVDNPQIGTYVKVALRGTDIGQSSIFKNENTGQRSVGSQAIIEVTAENVTPGAEVITFDSILVGAAEAT